MDLAIADGEDLAAPGRVGEILMRGPSCTAGYYRNPEATAALHFGQGYIRTGDLGYLDEARHLFVLGRSKNIIIRSGRNFAPREFEEIAEEAPEIKKTAAIGLDEGDLEGEQIHVFAEVNKKTFAERERAQALAQALMARFQAEIGVRPNRLHLVIGKTIPLTYNGKVKYTELKQAFSAGRLRENDALIHSF
jgi:acyl-CoA synthetase (AMP-forming)/AMP-acid ligase II